jgi:hypothetical protein
VTTRLRPGSSRDTVSSFVSATQTEPTPVASARGSRATMYWPTTSALPLSTLPTAFSSIPSRWSGAAMRLTAKAMPPVRTAAAAATTSVEAGDHLVVAPGVEIVRDRLLRDAQPEILEAAQLGRG